MLLMKGKKNVRPEEQDRRIKTKRKTNFKQVYINILFRLLTINIIITNFNKKMFQ